MIHKAEHGSNRILWVSHCLLDATAPTHTHTGKAGGFEFKDISLQEEEKQAAALSTPRSRLNPSTPNSSRGAPPATPASVMVVEENDMFTR